MDYKKLQEKAEELVKSRIKGKRKGKDEPMYLHSFRVAEKLEQNGYGAAVVLAGLLHDIIEDSDTTEGELSDFGYSDRIVQLVLLCSHKDEMKNKDARWFEMLSRLIVARDEDAWAIKLADILDNLGSSDSLSPDRRDFMRNVKAPALLAASKDVVGETVLWKAVQLMLSKLSATKPKKNVLLLDPKTHSKDEMAKKMLKWAREENSRQQKEKLIDVETKRWNNLTKEEYLKLPDNERFAVPLKTYTKLLREDIIENLNRNVKRHADHPEEMPL